MYYDILLKRTVILGKTLFTSVCVLCQKEIQEVCVKNAENHDRSESYVAWHAVWPPYSGIDFHRPLTSDQSVFPALFNHLNRGIRTRYKTRESAQDGIKFSTDTHTAKKITPCLVLGLFRSD